ncbi:MAG: NAD(P)/FAD-dependent oxidoreductase [Planctomycetaceae bacterium]|nr:NAD(P)/FAD-dependent oxidoreductase [Planctomycetaceae bacterium]
MATFNFDVAIIGGGVIGLAILHKAAGSRFNVVLLERHDALGRETSSRNSEVVHGGMYYPPNSLKAQLSVAGRRALYGFARKCNFPLLRIGKVIVATNEDEAAKLEAIHTVGRENDVEDLRLLTGEEVAQLAPGVKAVAGLHSPNTGVLNAHMYMDALAKTAEADGGLIVLGATVDGLARRSDGDWEIHYRDAEGPALIHSRVVVNAAGLGAQKVMAMAGINPAKNDLRLYPCKGSYFSVGGESRARIKSLVYPAPEANLAGLGIHTIVDFAGGVKLGPNVEYVNEADEYDYSVDPGLRHEFFTSASRYLPFLREDDIQPDMAGIRPKLSGPGQPARDFYIAHEAARGCSGFINLAGIESPGLTASPAIGDMVGDMIAALV